MPVHLVPIQQNKQCDTAWLLHPLADEVCAQTAANYLRAGFEVPWIGYLTFIDEINVGACGFKQPPTQGRVEIAYFTFPDFEEKGYGQRAAKELIRIAREAKPAVRICAQTLPEINASGHILQKLGFTKWGVIEDKDDGTLWEWELRETL